MADIHFTDINPADIQPSISEEQPMSPTLDPRRRSWSPNDKTSDALFGGPSPEDPNRSAISSPTYLDSPTAKYSGAGFVAGEEEDVSDEGEDWEEINITVPEVPKSPTKTTEYPFPPKGTVTQKVLNIEGVTTGESNEDDDKVNQDKGLDPDGEETLMIPAESPGQFLIHGASTGESTEDDVVEATSVEQGMEASGQSENQEAMGSSDEESELMQEEAGACARDSDGEDDGRKTPINYPLFLPVASADGRYPFFRDVDAQSVTSSVAVTVDDLDDYIEKAHLEDYEEGELDEGSATPPVLEEQQTAEAGRILLSPEEKDVFFTPDEGIPPVLEVLPEEQDKASGMEEDVDVTSDKQHESEEPSQQQVESSEMEVVESEDVSTAQELSLDMSQTELNTNNNSSNENSPRGEPIASSSPSTKDLLPQPTIKETLSSLEKRHLSLHSTPDSPESDGYKTVSDTAETPSPGSYDKDYPKGSVRSRARCYETQFSSEADDSSILEKSKSKSPRLHQPQTSTESEELPKSDSKLVSVEDAPEKESIPVVGSVQRQKKDIEKRLKSESDSESSPPSVRSSKLLEDSSIARAVSKADSSPPPVFEIDRPFGALSSSPEESSKNSQSQPKVSSEDDDTSKGQDKSELSPPPSDGAGKTFASPSLQSLEKGIVKKITQQLLSSDTATLAKDIKTLEPQVETSSAKSTSTDLSVTQKDDENQGKSQPVRSKEVPNKNRESTKKQEIVEPTNEMSSNTSEKLETELASDGAQAAEGDETTYSRFGDEKIPLAPGLVKRHTKDYEQRSVVEKLKEEVEMMEKTTSASSTDAPLVEASGTTGEEDEIITEKEEAEEETGAAPVYPDEGSSWRVGDVRRHKKVFEEMKGADEEGKILDNFTCCLFSFFPRTHHLYNYNTYFILTKLL